MYCFNECHPAVPPALPPYLLSPQVEVHYYVRGGEIVIPGRKVLHKYSDPVNVDMYVKQGAIGSHHFYVMTFRRQVTEAADMYRSFGAASFINLLSRFHHSYSTTRCCWTHVQVGAGADDAGGGPTRTHPSRDQYPRGPLGHHHRCPQGK